MNPELKDKLFELADLLEWFQENDLQVQDIGGDGLRVSGVQYLSDQNYHVYAAYVLEALKR